MHAVPNVQGPGARAGRSPTSTFGSHVGGYIDAVSRLQVGAIGCAGSAGSAGRKGVACSSVAR
jgi:hypothetical protein